MENSLYHKFKELGVDMSWYEKSKGNRTADTKAPIPLTDDHCGMLAIYKLTKSGKLFTCTSDGEPYQQVRETGKTIARDIFICMACNKQFKTYKEASGHYAEKTTAEADNQGAS